MSEYYIITRVLITLTSLYYYDNDYKARRYSVLLLFFNIKETKSLNLIHRYQRLNKRLRIINERFLSIISFQ